MNISFIGMPGSGKSTIGRLAAEALGWPFIDTDPLIERREGAPLQTVLDRLGTEAFLDVEAEVVAALTCESSVIAPGGSVVLRERGARRLKELGPVVWLKLPYPAVERRLGNLATRGVTLAPGQSLEDLYNYRQPFYEKYADLVIPSDLPTPRDTLEAALAALKEWGV